jgi:Carboxymuconolactone decarboxylase family
VTVSALIAMNRPNQLRSHFARARENGVTREELIETITHLAFYAGWPSAVTALDVAKEVFESNSAGRCGVGTRSRRAPLGREPADGRARCSCGEPE